MMDYSQYGEQAIIAAYFGNRNGRFLDIGAHDGQINSNTRHLALNGWGGVCVEPAPEPFVVLKQRYAGSPVKCVQAVIADRNGLYLWHDSDGDQVGTISDGHRDHWAKVRPYLDVWVAGVTGAELLATLPGPYTFVNIDVEGTNLEVLRSLPLADIGCEILCVECDADRHAMRREIERQGFRQYAETSGNLLAVRK